MARSIEQADSSAKTIASNLARIRRESGITQVELAQRLGVTQQIVSAYECGRLRLHGEVLQKLARILNTTADQILGIQQDKKPAVLNGQFTKRIRKIETLSKRDQQALLKTIDAFLSKSA